MLNNTVFKAYDIRGKWGEEIDEGGVMVIIDSIVATFKDELKGANLVINCGFDMRNESKIVYQIALSRLQELGCHVIDIGMCPTSTAYFAISNMESNCAIQITASHNPSGYMGIKPFCKVENKIVKLSGLKVLEKLNFPSQARDGIGSYKKVDNIIAKEVDFVIENYPKINSNHKIVVDTANGMGVTLWQNLEAKTELKIEYLNSTLDGTFPNHLSDTLQHKFWTNLCEDVRSKNAKFGIATDGDGDRIAFISEKGEFIPNSLVTCILIDALHKSIDIKSAQVDIRSILNVVKLTKNLGINLHIGPVGHAKITQKMNSDNIDFSGESSGHYFFSSRGGAESILDVLYLFLVALEDFTCVSEMVSHFQSANEKPELNFVMPNNLSKEKIFEILKSGEENAKISTLDGITFDYDTWRYNVRTSNTEPVLRLNIESFDKNILEKENSRIVEILLNLGCTYYSH